MNNTNPLKEIKFNTNFNKLNEKDLSKFNGGKNEPMGLGGFGFYPGNIAGVELKSTNYKKKR